MYITFYKQTQNHQTITSFAEIMQNLRTNPIINFYKTTVFVPNPTPRNQISSKQQQKINQAETYIEKAWDILKEFENNYETQYYQFQIPKHSGGLRTINAPLDEFKQALAQVKDIFEQNLKCLAHNSAYAYTKNRSTLDALTIHQNNQSNWYLKIDLSDFFPNCTPDLIYNQLKKQYPFYYFSEKHNALLLKIIKTCCLNGGLPQGTPMSPLLTNLLMVPYDYTLNNYLKRGTGEHFVYTRYADDILISSKSNFEWKPLTETLQNFLQPFQIKQTKTRYGSKAGRNWNLGLMLNKDNKITLGASKKKLINAMLNNFIKDYKANILWSKEDVQHLQGQLSYLQQIEPEYYCYIIQKYQTKYNIPNYRTLIKTILN